MQPENDVLKRDGVLVKVCRVEMCVCECVGGEGGRKVSVCMCGDTSVRVGMV